MDFSEAEFVYITVVKIGIPGLEKNILSLLTHIKSINDDQFKEEPIIVALPLFCMLISQAAYPNVYTVNEIFNFEKMKSLLDYKVKSFMNAKRDMNYLFHIREEAVQRAQDFRINQKITDDLMLSDFKAFIISNFIDNYITSMEVEGMYEIKNNQEDMELYKILIKKKLFKNEIKNFDQVRYKCLEKLCPLLDILNY